MNRRIHLRSAALQSSQEARSSYLANLPAALFGQCQFLLSGLASFGSPDHQFVYLKLSWGDRKAVFRQHLNPLFIRRLAMLFLVLFSRSCPWQLLTPEKIRMIVNSEKFILTPFSEEE
jgi:hypothetical protein